MVQVLQSSFIFFNKMTLSNYKLAELLRARVKVLKATLPFQWFEPIIVSILLVNWLAVMTQISPQILDNLVCPILKASPQAML